MTEEQIRRLINNGEDYTTEFKECTNALGDSVYETVCSFSNRYGGYMLLGVHDSGEILGVNPKSVTNLKKNFVTTLNNPNKISPTLLLSLSEIEVDGRIILYVYIPTTSQVEFCSGRLFDRNFDSDVDITNSGELAAQLISRKSGEFSERKIFPYATLDDLRLELIPVAKQLALSRNEKHPWKDMSDMEFLRSAGLFEEDRMSGKKRFNLYVPRYSGKNPEFIDGDIFRITVPLDDDYSYEAGSNKAQIKRNLKRNLKRNDRGLIGKTVLIYLGEHPEATQMDVAKAIGKSRRAVQDTITALKAGNLLEREGARKNGRWIVKLMDGDVSQIIAPIDDTYSFDEETAKRNIKRK
jgi:predicted HTH transcriptional regulator